MPNISTYKDEGEAYAQIKEAGYHAVELDFPAVENDFHRHDFKSLIYITQGELTLIEQDSGETTTCGPGAKIIGTPGLVHRELSEGYSAILGLSAAPDALTQPIDKPLPVRL